MSTVGEIKRIENGLIFSTFCSETYFANIDELFDYLLLRIEGRSDNFKGESYGYVKVFRQPNVSFTSPKESL